MARVVRKVHVRVERIVFRPCFWRVGVRIRNTARVPIRVTNGFSLLVADATKSRQNALPRLDATYFSRPLPRRLRSGEAWNGFLGGEGIPRRKTRVRLALGLFQSKRLCRGCIGFGVTTREFAWP